MHAENAHKYRELKVMARGVLSGRVPKTDFLGRLADYFLAELLRNGATDGALCAFADFKIGSNTDELAQLSSGRFYDEVFENVYRLGKLAGLVHSHGVAGCDRRVWFQTVVGLDKPLVRLIREKTAPYCERIIQDKEERVAQKRASRLSAEAAKFPQVEPSKIGPAKLSDILGFNPTAD